MSNPFAGRRAAFRALHVEGCFALPNPWDAGSAKRLQKLGFKALASTSAGAAWALGKDDGEITREGVIAHLAQLCAATDLPVNADFEAGFADAPEGVAESVNLAIEAGVAGLSIEDWSGSALYDLPDAVERLKAARAAIDASGQDVILVGRTEGYLRGNRDLAPTLERLKAHAAAGADCLYAPAVTDPEEIRAIVQAVAPKPVNILFWSSDMSVESLGALGVRRVSTGASLAAAAWAGFETVAKRLAEEGRL
uniref:isocitrate lyase/PEP mutase family protein n=1 Tax=uncultured Caulobacter sp. TaxID=158749 RepID=UPI0025FE85C8|nr:isocitrate lyase/phosphoenolpyruvate mutase family protein [uncultured Caulobacter sp.]